MELAGAGVGRAPALSEVGAEQAELHVIRRLVFGVGLEAGALEPLHLIGLAVRGVDLRLPRREGQPVHVHIGLVAALPAPLLEEAPANVEAADPAASFLRGCRSR